MIVGLTSVVIPSQERPESLLRAVESVLTATGDVEVIIVLDIKDAPSWGILPALEELSASRSVPLSVIPVEGDMHTAERWNIGAAASSGEFLVTGADDVEFLPGWYEAAHEGMEKLAGSGIVGFNDCEKTGSSFGALATHFMVSRKYAARRLGGVLMPPVYEHGYTDVEVTFRGKRDSKIVWADGARYTHHHPVHGKGVPDRIYDKGSESERRDERLFKRRLRKGFPDVWNPVLFYENPEGWGSVAVGLRSYDKAEPETFDSWTNFLMMGGLRAGDQVLRPARGMQQHIAANDLAARFLKDTECDSLLFIDDDMEWKADALSVLRDNADNWEHDVVSGFFTFRTNPPHAVAYKLSEKQPEMPEALLGESYDALAYVPDNSVTDVDAVGIAFTLVKRQVFECMLSEYGPEYTVWFDTGKHSELEDIRFSRRVREHGLTMAVDSHVKVEHVGKQTWGWDQHQQFVKQLENNYDKIHG